jgi:peptidoglycan-associated lipoprotein
MRRSFPVLLAAAALMLAACAHKTPQPTAGSSTAVPANEAGAQSAGAAGANSSESGGATAEGAGGAPPEVGLLAERTVYFDFDSSVIKGDGTAIVAAHAKYLAAHPSVHVRLEGNTDERGSPEYNIGLGERRAQSVRQAMLLQGVSDSQITTVSYGAERPVDPGHNEAAWAKNRRVDIVYLK